MAGIYVHIPFCEKRCIYCDFYSTTDKRLADSYIDALCKELAARKDELQGESVTTIYIGGGTPSQLSMSQLERFVSFLKRQINFDKIEEFTIEVNPDDVTPTYMSACRAIGVNRVSMGIQSFVDAELQEINRRHTSDEARQVVKIIKEAGFSNISIDLIYGLPLQTLETWRYSLAEAVALDVPHISCYNLSYEEGTVLYKKRENGEIKECGEDECVRMYEILVEELSQAGYEHYEISNFAKSGQYSCHNSNYWNLTPYLGIGASAHSFDGVVRRYNPASIKDYMQKVNDFGRAYEEETETYIERYNEYVMINLRTKWGVSLKALERMFDEEICAYFRKYSRRFVETGELQEQEGTFSLSERGVMLADYIIRTLMIVP